MKSAKDIDIATICTSKDFIWYRNAMGLTKEEMGKLIDKSRQQVWNLENGLTKPSLIHSIAYRVIWEWRIPDDEKEIRAKVADLGINFKDATRELIEKLKGE